MNGSGMRSASVVAALALFAAGAAEACRCVRQAPATAYRQAHAVLLGTVKTSQDVSAYDRTYRIDVERSWKRPIKNTIAVNSVRSSCLADLEPGKAYLMYVVRDPSGTMRTSACETQPKAAAGAALAWLESRK